MTPVTVVSTGWDPPSKSWCLESVSEQRGVCVDHRVFDASAQDPARTKIENVLDAVRDLPADRIVALVDLDDWLPGRGCLEHIAELHDNGAWLTYGSFAYADGRPGFASAYAPGEAVRTSPWRATHLKTFRAGLLHRVRTEDLHFRGKWMDRADDVAIMVPMLEMAGARGRYCSRHVYVYNLASSFEWSAAREDLAHERLIRNHISRLKPYDALDSLTIRGCPFDEAVGS